MSLGIVERSRRRSSSLWYEKYICGCPYESGHGLLHGPVTGSRRAASAFLCAPLISVQVDMEAGAATKFLPLTDLGQPYAALAPNPWVDSLRHPAHLRTIRS